MSKNSDLLLVASFDDQTQQFFDNLAKNFDNAKTASDTANTGMANNAQQSSAAMGLVAGAIGGVTAKLTEMALEAASALPALVAESTKLAAAAETADVALGVVAENAGSSAEEVTGLKNELISMGIASGTASNLLLKMAGAEIDLTKATDLANIALDTATVAGTSEEEVINRAIHAITTKNTVMLGDLQLTTTMAEATADLAREQGIAASQVDGVAQKTALFNAVVKAGTKFAGARTAASKTAGKQMANMDELATNLKTSFGQLFLPAYTEWVSLLANNLAEAQKWLDENSDSVAEFAQRLAVGMKAAIEIIEGLKNALAGVPDFFLKAGQSLAVLVSGMDDAELEERTNRLGETAAQVATLIVTAFATGIKAITEGVQIMAKSIMGALTFIGRAAKAPMSEWKDIFTESMADTTDQVMAFGDNVQETAQKTAETMMMLTGLADLPIEEKAEEFKKVASAVDTMNQEIEASLGKITELNTKFTEELAKVAKQRMRQDIDAAIQESRRREDIERTHQDRLGSIRESADEREKALGASQKKELLKLEEDANQERIDAELAFRRQMQDIQSDFLFNVEEAARSNDAVAIARLMRTNEKQIEDAKLGRDRQEQDRVAGLQKERDELKANQEAERQEIAADLEERLAQAEEARQKDIENLNRSLERQREDQARHRAWEDEDRIAAFEAELTELGAHFGQIEGVTAEHFKMLLEEHGAAIQDLDALWEGFNERQAGRAASMTTPGASRGGSPAPFFETQATTYEGQSQDLQRFFEQSGGFGLANGGFGVVDKPTPVMIGEKGPEAFAAMPMSQTVNHRLSGRAGLDVSGLSRQGGDEVERAVVPMLIELLQGVKA